MHHTCSPTTRYRRALAAAATLVALILTSPLCRAGFDEGKAAFDAKDYKLALQEWSAAAAQGDPRSLFQLAILHERGLGTEKNIAEALRLARLAAGKGEANAQFALAVLLDRGQQYPKDPVESKQWLEQGIASAQKGDPVAQYVLSQLHKGGVLVAKDDGESLNWLRRAANGGHAAAQLALGERYLHGNGVEQDDSQAALWLSKAAAQGEWSAQYQLVPILRKQFESAPDDASAVKALRASADLRDANAQYLLAVAYWRGRGIERDPLQACTWMLIAGADTAQLAKALKGIDQELTPPQIEQCRQAADRWNKAHPPLKIPHEAYE